MGRAKNEPTMLAPMKEYDMYGASGVTTDRFHAGSSIEEGVGGLAKIDTTFENTERNEVLAPRSRAVENYTRDESQNRGEWGR